MHKTTPLRLAHSALTGQIIESAHTVYNHLGEGFLESVYVRSLCVELTRQQLAFEREKPFVIRYSGVTVGEYRADLVVANLVIVEVKAVDKLTLSHSAQTINYLKVSGLPVGLLLNFGPTTQVRRLTNPRPESARSDR